MTRLIDELLDVTRVMHGKVHLQRERLDLDELLQRTVEGNASEDLAPAPADGRKGAVARTGGWPVRTSYCKRPPPPSLAAGKMHCFP